ncbi:hypothetical protein Hokovirus_3_221 [Hokovirus HKV1]|uniref:Uncharacterized protein n=1 Tax=Hokovirus HKV1 TaxID=1977638 RepID=A0A1V0SH36_9VIRU|nr:hypothetical protein Hokovirus_3_221 [Hokovirus HKV1]
MSFLFNKGIILVFIGIIILIHSLIYLYYYKINQLSNEENKIKNKLFGPQLLLALLLIMYIFIFVYHGYSFIIYLGHLITDGKIEAKLIEKCNYTTFEKKITKNISSNVKSIKSKVKNIKNSL